MEGIGLVERLGRFGGGWLIRIEHEHLLTNSAEIIWVSDEFFELSDADQATEIERLKAEIYDPVDVAGGYMAAWQLFHEGEGAKNHKNYDAHQRIADAAERFGVYSLQWYCAHVIKIIEMHTGWQSGKSTFADPNSGPTVEFAAGFKAGYLFSEAGWKHDFEIDAMRGIRTKNAATEGAKQRKASLAPRTKERLGKMQRLVARGHSISRAAEVNSKKGLGTSKCANLKLWYRHRPN